MRLFTLDQDIEMNLDSSSSLRQQSIGTHSTPIEYPDETTVNRDTFHADRIS